ncbi:hypothetical protein [Lactococcus ileimucosae]|uniref:hypothetical protein n=1 Tax=Lactococcus ileimucosae TaxID=2941329 RepID=UPI002043938A|nr:hypothetical protein [Lactococcus ileimucosae]
MKITPKNYQEIAKRAYSVDSKYKDGEITRTGDKAKISEVVARDQELAQQLKSS